MRETRFPTKPCISNEPVTDEDAARAKSLMAGRFRVVVQPWWIIPGRTLVETDKDSAQRDAILAKYSENVIGPPLNGLLWG